MSGVTREWDDVPAPLDGTRSAPYALGIRTFPKSKAIACITFTP